MSSHREAPESSKDPAADSTDVYAFVSPDNAEMVTLIANYIPFESPDGGPNFYEFADDVQYDINVDNDGDGLPDITFRFKFTTTPTAAAGEFFLYNTGTISAPTSSAPGYANWSRPQTYKLSRIDYKGGKPTKTTVLGNNLLVPPCNIGPLSTPTYTDLVTPAIHSLAGGGSVFAGQRAEGFYVDLGAVFDLGNLRPFEADRASSPFTSAAMGVNSTDRVNVHSLAIQIPITKLTSTGSKPASTTATGAVIGVWTAASRQKVRMYGGEDGETTNTGPFVQVSRLGNPLVNELLIPMTKKDKFNSQQPAKDAQFADSFTNPGLAQLLPSLYASTVFPNLAAYNKANPAPNNKRADIEAILLTGIPAGVVTKVPTYTTQATGSKAVADMLRLNVAIPPTTANPNNLGLLGGDIAGFPNGRRVFDDVATIELRAVAGATLGLVDPNFTPDTVAGAPFATSGYVNFGLTNSQTDTQASGQGTAPAATEYYLPAFPYLGTPHSGFDANTAVAATGGNPLAGAAAGPLPASGN
jgi:hypothetical protein